MDGQHHYEIILKKDELLINLSSDDVYFISKQMDKWFRILLDDSYVPVSMPARPVAATVPVAPPPVAEQPLPQPQPVYEAPVQPVPQPAPQPMPEPVPVAVAPVAPPPVEPAPQPQYQAPPEIPAPQPVPVAPQPEPVVQQPAPVAAAPELPPPPPVAPVEPPPVVAQQPVEPPVTPETPPAPPPVEPAAVAEPLPPVPAPVAEMPVAPAAPVLDEAVQDDFEAVMDSLMKDFEDDSVTATPNGRAAEPPDLSVTSLAELCDRSHAGSSEDYLLLSAFYLTRFENQDKFSLKKVNSMLVKSGLTPVNHSVLETTLGRGYLAMVPDMTGLADVSEYVLTTDGQDAASRLL